MKALTFTNISDTIFVCKWDGQEYTFEPGETQMYEAGVAYHFGKHLANRELDQVAMEKEPKFQDYLKKCLGDTIIKSDNQDKLRAEMANTDIEDAIDYKAMEMKDLKKEASDKGVEVKRGMSKPKLIEKLENADAEEFEEKPQEEDKKEEVKDDKSKKK